MNETALISLFGDALLATGDRIEGTVLDDPSRPFLGIDPLRQFMVNAPAGLTLYQTSPALYHLRDATGRIWSCAPDGTRDEAMDRLSSSTLSCLALRRFPAIAPASDAFSPIPRRLHFICNDRATLDPALIANIERTAAINPGWEVTLWDEAARFEFITEHYGWDVLKLYLMIGPEYGAAKADLFRYLLIFKLGGVYLDLKSTTARPLDAILREDDAFILSQWNMSGSGVHRNWGLGATIAHVKGGEYQQWFLIARPLHPYLRRVIQLVLTRIAIYRPDLHGVGAVTTFNVTGPHAFTKAIYPVRDDHPHRMIDSETEGLIYSVVEDHRARSGSDYRTAQTALVTGNETYRL
ncbi:glycosyltransferase family 32 protein [Asaia krungthepensis]|uniref:Glycosyltransferase n=1 Tax=Asaia krungthepensis NRIC 0535 TaxID=1307925 RepID=A0ABQ0Q5K3_9PROT|nr:glycosyltransferase [Asaia krungthepensis]GBQ92476.1 hypothetical protein AA0535_2563 [Asaia krungthepensis NRIC 0535]